MGRTIDVPIKSVQLCKNIRDRLGSDTEMGMRSPTWHIHDLIDFEYFVQEDENTPERELRRRDRDIFRQIASEANTMDAPGLLRLWLDKRRECFSKSFREERTPGQKFGDGYETARMALAVVALLGGISFMGALCHYDGTAPVSVGQFVLWFVGVQYALFFGLLLIKLTPRLQFAPQRAIVQRLLLSLLKFAAEWCARIGIERLGFFKDSRWRALFGDAKAKTVVYKDVWYWPMATLAQVFMLVFNLAALLYLTLSCIGEDLAFAWESSLTSSAEQVHAIVEILRVPWRWMPQGDYPTLEQIRSSQYVKAQGIKPLADESLKAWIPFVWYTVAAYGVGVRATMVAATLALQRRAICGLRFDYADARCIVERMKLPALIIEQPKDEPEYRQIPNTSDSHFINATENYAKNSFVLWGVNVDSGIEQWMKGYLGWTEGAIHRISPPQCKWSPAQDVEEVVIGVNALRPPAGDLTLFIKNIISCSKPPRVRVVAVTGQPADQEVWEKELRSLGSPYVDQTLLEYCP